MSNYSYKLNADELAFRDSFRQILSKRCTAEQRRKRIASIESIDAGFFQELADFGLTSFFSSPKDFPSSFRDLVSIARDCGNYLVAEPIVEFLFAGPFLIGHVLSEAERVTGAAFVQSIIAPSTSGTLGFATVAPLLKNARQRTAPFTFVAGASSAAFLLHGNLLQGSLLQGVSKDSLVISSLTPTSCEPRAVLDTSVKRFTVNSVGAPLLELSVETSRVLELFMRVLYAAEILGALEQARDMTVEFVKTRKQFGVAIGTFQAVQHALADIHLHCESLRALVQFASWAAVSSSSQLDLAARSAFYYACEIGSRSVEKTIQLHGGIGFTWEYDLHLFLRRVKTIELICGPSATDFAELRNFVPQNPARQ